nr:polysaccharide deacetylase family protein [Neobacillus sp.]
MKKILLFPLLLSITFCYNQMPVSASTKSRAMYEKTGHVIWDINTKEKMVAITFDDGPHPVFTPQILNILAKYNAKATFFVAGNKVKRFPEILRREVKEGHEIANHTYNHIYDRNITAATLTAELEETDKLIQSIIGYKPTLYRPVGGLYNDLIINTAVKNGKLVILWSWNKDPKDWQNPAASRICRDITEEVRPGNIILLHDWHGSEFSQACQTVLALDTVLDFLSKNGYKCVTVSEMLYRSNTQFPEPFDPFH